MSRFFSIGSGNEDLGSFIKRLEKWKIDFLVDLRSKPYSGYVPHFDRESLSDSLEKAGIGYLYFGDKLGGRPQEGFQKFRRSPKFRENIDLLLSQVEGKVTALMCTEFDMLKCHRRFIVVELIKKGIDVTVIDKEGNAAIDSKNQTKLTGF